MKDKAIEALKQLIEDSKSIRNGSSLTSWKNKATNILVRIYGKDSEPIQQIKNINYTGDSFIQTKQKIAHDLAVSLVEEIESFDLPNIQLPNSSDGIHINITQSQNQEIKVNLEFFIEAIRDGLTGSQQKELQQIIDEPEPVSETKDGIEQPTKKTRIAQKLKSFGGDVASNIVANILTNPGLFVG